MKASFNLSWTAIEKALNIITLLSLFFWIHPAAIAQASSLQSQGFNPALVFNIEPKPNSEEQTTQTPVTSLRVDEVIKNDPLTIKLQEYLGSKGSPFAPCASTLVQQSAWKKIVSLSNAESAFGKYTTPGSYNYWGVMAGNKLKKMGNDPCEAIVNMQSFLENYPKNSAVKYKDMPIDCGPGRKLCMNGFYKQPYAYHWTANNLAIINVLDKMEAEAMLERTALAVETGPAITASTAELSLVTK